MVGMTEVVTRDLTEERVDALVACVRRCYGESYPEADFYDPAALRELLRSERLVSKLAVVGDGRVVGHLGTRFERTKDVTAHLLGGFVDPDYRNQGILIQLGAAAHARYRELGLVGTWMFATTAHGRSQRMLERANSTATGVLLGHIPADIDYRGIEPERDSRRVGAIAFYQSFGPAPAVRVFVPPRYAELVRSIYRDADLPRDVRSGSGHYTSLHGVVRYDAKRQVAVFRFGQLANGELGDAGTAQPLAALLDRASQCHAEVSYADVPLANEGAPGLIAELWARGFGFGALLPASERSETLRLQRVSSSRVSPERMVLVTPRSAELLAWILEEQAQLAAVPRESERR